MNRRDFLHHLAVMAAGVAALPMQIDAFERAFTLNASPVEKGLISIRDIYIGGMASRSLPARFEFLSGTTVEVVFGINLFGGVLRWVAVPDQPIITSVDRFSWCVTDSSGLGIKPDDYAGYIRYVEQSGRYMTAQLTGFGTLANHEALYVQ